MTDEEVTVPEAVDTDAAPDAVGSDDVVAPELADAESAIDDAAIADVAELADPSADAPDGATGDDGTTDQADSEAGGTEVLTEEELLQEEPETPPVESPYDRPGKWYVLHTQSGYENKVLQNLEARTHSMNMESRIHETVIPMEDVVEFKGGKKVVVKKKMFPGYLLVRCKLDDDSWYVIRNTPGVTGFVGAGNKPQPLPRKDVENFLQVKTDSEEAPKRTRPRLEYDLNETVRVKEGPFADFSGEIVEINEDQLKVKVLVNIFGRETPVELEFSQIAKL
jgi:transcription termination/antitermination protein NusG